MICKTGLFTYRFHQEMSKYRRHLYTCMTLAHIHFNSEMHLTSPSLWGSQLEPILYAFFLHSTHQMFNTNIEWNG